MKLIPVFVHRRLEHRPNLLKILDNIGWLFIDKILRMGVGLFIGVWIARYLGPEQFGLLNFALAITGLLGIIATLGLKSIVVRDIVRAPDCAKETLGTTAMLHVIGGMGAFLVGIVLVAYLRPDDAQARAVVAILGAINLLNVSQIAVYWFESRVQSKYTVWVQNGVFLLFAVIKVFMILLQAPFMAFVWMMVGEAVVTALVLLIVMGWVSLPLNSLAVKFERAKILLSDSWPLALSSMAIMVYMKIDQIMLGQMIGDEAVGIYSAALRFSEIWYFIPMTIVASVFPAILEAKIQNEELYYLRLQQLYNLMIMISLPIAIVMTFLSDWIVTIVFGVDYEQAGLVLAIHIWASIFVFLGVAGGQWYIAENKLVLSLQRAFVGAISNIFFNYLLIPEYGVVGAAIALVISQAIASWLYDGIQPITRKMFFMKLSALKLQFIKPIY